MTTTKARKPTASTIAAQVLGQQAFVNGKPRIPVTDDRVMMLIAESNGNGINILKDWLRGWDEANLCADIQ